MKKLYSRVHSQSFYKEVIITLSIFYGELHGHEIVLVKDVHRQVAAPAGCYAMIIEILSIRMIGSRAVLKELTGDM